MEKDIWDPCKRKRK